MADLELTNELIKELCGYLEDGNYRSVACQLCGFTEKELDEWFKKADKGDRMCQQLKKKVLWAEAEAERSAVYSLVTAGRDGDVKAVMEYLKNKHPERWDRQGKTASIEDNDINISLKVIKSTHKSNIDEEELKDLE